MNNPHLQFHHFGLAIRRPDEAQKFVSALGYQLGDAVFDSSRNVHLQFATHATQPAVEIIWPGTMTGPVDKLTKGHPQGIVYHLCYETENLTAAIAGLEATGLLPICISPAAPAPLFGGRLVSFYNVVGMGLVEILE